MKNGQADSRTRNARGPKKEKRQDPLELLDPEADQGSAEEGP